MKLSTTANTAVLALIIRVSIASSNSSADESPILNLNLDDTFNFDILSSFQQALAGAADVSPILAAVKDIIPGDWDSFTQNWFHLANHTKTQALELEHSGGHDPVNLRSTWFAVANYFRRADTYNRIEWSDPRINAYWTEQRSAFDKAIATLQVPGHRVQIPAGDFTVEAIWYSQPVEGNYTKRSPTLVLGQGYDASQEDLYATLVAPALERGWNVLSYEGPGQPTVRREQGVGFIPDWERVVTPVIDYLLSSKATLVDPERLALYGHSFGGYTNARAAAFEPRLSALMLNGGVWDMYDAYTRFMSDNQLQMLESGQKENFDRAFYDLPAFPETPTVIRWAVLQGLWAFNIRSPYDLFQAMKSYTLTGGIAEKIKMPVWIADGEFETTMPGQSQMVKDALGERAELHIFNGAAGFHCQTGATQELARVMFAWLDKTLPSS